ncbi:cell division protein FtsQ/DivIB [Microbaculum marinum]|uniref:Cell division protein FtsQ n=1 Tax=Microbaculum marinum TaxID=1764581 RepID=A0AAW9RPW5_9HYPH
MRSLGLGLRKVAEGEAAGAAGGRRRILYTNLPPRRPARRGLAARLIAPFEGWTPPRRVGLYSTAALFAAVGIYGAVLGGHLDSMRHAAFVAADYVTARAGFGIRTVVISGQEEVHESDVLRGLEIGEDTSLLTFNAQWARRRLSDIAWVKSATVQKLFPGTLHIDLVEREAYALWQLGGIISMIDRDGEVIGELSDQRFAGLPLVVGTGANRRVDELMALIRPHPSVSTRLRAAVRVADRRWNLVLDNGIEVRLPETGAEEALLALDELSSEKGLMARDIVLVDLRLNDRVVVRLSEQAAVQRDATIKSRGGSSVRKGQDT